MRLVYACDWVNTAASGGGTEAGHAEHRGEEISLANLHEFNRISRISMRIRTSDRSTSQMVEAADVTMMVGSFDAVFFAGCCRRDS